MSKETALSSLDGGDYYNITEAEFRDGKTLNDIEIDKEDTPWLNTDIKGEDFSNHIFFILFGEDGKPLVEEGQTIRKSQEKKLKTPGD